MKRLSWLPIVFIGVAVGAQPPAGKSEPSIRAVSYRDGNQSLESLVAIDPSVTTKRPATLLAVGPVHSPAAKARLTQFAKMGYVAWAADLTGRNHTGPVDRATAVRRLNLALEQVAKHPQVAAHKVAGVGYGLGGTYMLDVARSGAELNGVACFHSDLSARDGSSKISGRVLLLIGSEDPLNTNDKLDAFEKEMRGGNVDWDIVRYGAVGPAFTDEQAKTYDDDADLRGHAAVRQFLAELFPTTFASRATPPAKAANTPPKGIPDKVLRVLQYVDEHDTAQDGYEGGRHFGNFERKLTLTDRSGRRIRYREWDVNPLRPGVNRGPERLVTGSDGSAYFTDDHYTTFKKIR